MSSNYGFQPTLSGLNTIESDNTMSANIICDTISIANTGTAPTMTAGDNSNRIATTAFVSNAVSSSGAGYVTLGTNQTITGTKTYTLQQNIPIIKGQYIDLFAGQFRMFSGSAGGSAISIYVPPSGSSIIDFSTTNADMVGQYNLTSNNITCSIAPTTGNEYCNKTYVDTVAG